MACLGGLAFLARRELERRAYADGFSAIEANRARLFHGPGWVDPRWNDELARTLAPLGKVAADDRAAVESIAAKVRELSFVERADAAEVLWPDGVRVDVTLRSPVACVLAGERYFPVSPDGVVLSGAWPAPPARGAGWLPTLWLEADHERELGPGDRLLSPAAQDGLSLATSIWIHFEGDDLVRLGRVTIDARQARHASVDHAGAELLLEGGRRVLFGRAPSTDEPGELPVEHKWKLVRRALALLDPGSGGADWDRVDVRWDQGEIVPRAAPAAAQVGQGDFTPR